MGDVYTLEEQAQLLSISRRTLEAVTRGDARPRFDSATYTPALKAERACFVTFEIDHQLRGCTGTLVARRCLADEVSVTTVQTAFNDPRFPPVIEAEVPHIQIELSILTPPVPLTFDSPEALIQQLRPGVDGVTLQLGLYRGTFLPQVWEKVPDPIQFLTMLSRKMGLPGNGWRHPKLEAETYQAILIQEVIEKGVS